MTLVSLGVLVAFVAIALLSFFIGRRSAMGRAASALDAQHQVIFDSSPTFIWYKDRHNRILRVNQSAAASVGRDVRDVEGRMTEEIYPEEAAKYYADDLEVMDSGVPKLGIVEQLVESSGRKRWVRTDKIPYRDQTGQIVGVIVFALDITDQKLAEVRLEEAKNAAELANRAKSDFLANVSHEIRTPLGTMMGFSELLTSSDVTPETRLNYAEKILRNGERLKRLIDELLDLSRVEQGRMYIENVSFSLPSLLAEVTSLLGQKAREKRLSLQVRNADAVPETIVSDPLRLRQILVNVGTNAVKFTDSGTITLEIVVSDSASVQEPKQKEVSFVIRDTGRGIAADKVTQLFQPFYQTDPMDARRFGGAGLGLALSRRLARELGGDLVLSQTTVGRGSTFVISIKCEVLQGPAARSEPVVPLSVESSPIERVERKEGVRHVLLAEDNPDIQEMVRHFLRQDGTHLSIVADGRQAVDVAMAEHPDIVLMDLQLPVLAGIDATRELRRRGFAGPIVAMTAHAMKGQRQICLDAGFTDFLPKPVSRQELLGRIHASLSRRT